MSIHQHLCTEGKTRDIESIRKKARGKKRETETDFQNKEHERERQNNVQELKRHKCTHSDKH